MLRDWLRARAVDPALLTLALLAIVYLAVYVADPYRPGMRPAHPLGWMEWSDQGHYWASARALAHGDLSSGNHVYPILYPAIGAAFVRFTPAHPFLVINLLATLLVAGAFQAVARKYVGGPWAIALFWLSVLLEPWVYRQFVIPWTSTVAAALFAGLIWELHRGAGVADRTGPLRCFRFGLLAGLLVPTRPIDAVVAVPFGALFLLRLARTASPTDGIARRSRLVRQLLSGLLGGLTGPSLFFGFNLVSHGAWFGPYFDVVGKTGFDVLPVAGKLVSFLLDSQTIYLDPTASILSRMPWMLLTMAGAALVAWLGDGLLRSIVAAAVLQVFLYLSYSDFLPTSLWRYHLIHYFKWFAPYAILFIAVGYLKGRDCWTARGRRFALVAVVALAVAGAGAGFRLLPEPVSVSSAGSNRYRIANPERVPLDVIDIPDASGSFPALYTGGHVIRTASGQLDHARDFRVIPAPGGARLVLFRPLSEAEAEITLDRSIVLPPSPPAPKAYSRRWAWGVPRWMFWL